MNDSIFREFRQPQILIVDDTLANLKLLADLIAPKGYQIRPATSGKLALRAVRAEKPDLILLDVMMPEMDGYEVCRQLKADPDSACIPVIFISGLGEVEDKVKGFELGGVDYITKPFQGEEVLARVETHLALRNLQQDLAAQNVRLQREISKREKAEAKLLRLNSRLKALYEISTVINRSIEMDQLLPDIIHVLTDTRILSFSLKGAIFLLEGGAMRLASFANLSENEVMPCKKIIPGECLCGIAAATGELLVSHNSSIDPRHTICIPGAEAHGHIVIPLRAFHRVVGVLVLYTEVDYQVSEQTLNLLRNIGSQIGIAVYNARLYEETKLSSLQDALTGLANRRSLNIELDKALKAATRYSEPLSIIILDIDHFKRYNDTLGHVRGDQLLIQLAGILTREIRQNDQVFRYGGEEFLVLLTRTDPDSARRTADRLRLSVSSETEVTISLGVAAFEEDQDQENLIDRADKALYEAKHNGRNRVEVNSSRS